MKFKVFIFLVTLLISGFCAALDLQTAKSQGLVGELPNGYLGLVKRSPEAVTLVKEVNQKRKNAYAGIAKKNGTSVEEVGKLAGNKLLNKATPNEYVKLPGGPWRLKSQVR